MKTYRAFVVIIGLLAGMFAGEARHAEAASWEFVDGGSLSSNNAAFPQLPVATVHNGGLYVAWYESLSSPPGIRIKKFDGSTWSNAGSSGDILVEGTNINQIQPALASYNGALYLAYVDYDSVWGNSRIQVKKYNGSTWSSYNNNNYNIVPSGSCPTAHPNCNNYPGTNINHMFNAQATSPSLLAANGKLYVSWMEYPNSISHYNIRVAQLDTSVSPDWQMIDGDNNTGLNYNVNKDAEENVPLQMSWFNNKLYIGWNEVDVRKEFRVKEYNPSGGTWAFVDGGGATGLNYDPSNMDVINPHLATFNSSLYAIWSENTYNDPVWGATGELRYKIFDGSTWSSDGSPDGRSMLNYDITNAPYYPVGVVNNNFFYVAWSEAAEISGNYFQQLRVASFNGTTRTMIDGNMATGLNGSTTNSVYQPKVAILNGDLYAVWRESTDAPSYQNWIRAKKYPLPPYVTTVSVPANGTYKIGDNLNFTVNFNKAVTVSGSPYLPVTLDTGGTVDAVYQSGSGTTALIFRYTVQSGVQDGTGVTVGAALNTNGGTLRDAAANDAGLTLNSVASTVSVLVDGVPPTAAISYSPAGPYKAGDSVTITATFSESMAASPVPMIAISGANSLAVTAMTRTDATHYTYTHNVSSGSGTATVALSVGTDLAGNTVTATPTSDATFVVSATYTVTYSGNGNTGGSVPIDATAYLSGATVTVLDNSGLLIRTGYTFAGWNTAADGGGTTYAPTATLTISGNTTLYAKWTINNYTLTISLAGNGNGTVATTSPDSAINCIKGSTSGCSADYTAGTSVTLSATGDWKSLFTGWSDGVTGSATPVTFTMDAAAMAVTATFNPNSKAKLLPGSDLFASIQDAYASVQSGAVTIQAQTWFFLEDLLFNNGTAVTLTGGMDTSYNPTTDYSTVKSLTVGTGSVVIGNISIK